MEPPESVAHVNPAMRLLTHPLARKMFRIVMRDRASIFMLHRREDRSTGVHGHTAAFLRESLSALQRSGARFVPLRTLVDAWSRGESVDPDGIAFTVDDGFADQAELVRDTFVAMNCPVTVFLISGFLDGKLWPWDDQLSFAVKQAAPLRTTIAAGHVRAEVDLTSQQGRADAVRELRLQCKRGPNTELYEIVGEIGRQLGVTIPVAAPSHHRAMSWDTARELEAAGVDFGPHTVTHRIISQLSDREAEDEIEQSWMRLRQELQQPVPIFAWPTGRACDYSDRDIALARKLGLRAGVATDPAYAHVRRGDSPQALYRLHRFSLPRELSTVLRYGSWVDRGRDLLRM